MSYPVPYKQPIDLSRDTEITVEAHAHPGAKRITLAFCKDGNYNSNCQFVFDIRFANREIVRNTHHGNWGAEEKSGGLPINPGDHFEVKFVVSHDKFAVFINKNHFCDYKHRVNRDEAKCFVVEGEVTIKGIHGGAGGVSSGTEHHHPAVPLTVPINGVHSGHKSVIRGRPTGSGRFNINYASGPNYDLDVILTIDIRFAFGSDHNVVVMNHKSGPSWGAEERHTHGFPFAANSEFEMCIKYKNNAFKILVDDEKLATFPARISPENARYFFITGDVKLEHVRV